MMKFLKGFGSQHQGRPPYSIISEDEEEEGEKVRRGREGRGEGGRDRRKEGLSMARQRSGEDARDRLKVKTQTMASLATSSSSSSSSSSNEWARPGSSKSPRLQRLFGSDGRCLNVAIDHGVFGEARFLSGIEDMTAVLQSLISAGPGE